MGAKQALGRPELGRPELGKRTIRRRKKEGDFFLACLRSQPTEKLLESVSEIKKPVAA